MIDIALNLINDGAFGNKFDLAVASGDLVPENGLRSAVIVSLFTDKRVTVEETYPNASRGGWWGDMLTEIVGDQIGSKLWLLDRAKTIQETLTLAEEYALEALQWMIEDGVASDITTAASFSANKSLLLEVVVTRPNGQNVSYTFDNAWTAEETR